MQTREGRSAEWVVKALTSGRVAEKLEAQRLLAEEAASLDLNAIRNDLLRLLRDQYGPMHETPDDARDLGDTRSWCLSALGYVPAKDGEPEATLQKHLDLAYEPNYWARYWTLEALLRRNPANLAVLCDPVAANDNDVLPKMLATAIIAQSGSAAQQTAQRKVIRDVLEARTDTADEQANVRALGEKWGVLRALRFVYLSFAVRSVASLVEHAKYDDNTYDAIVALGNVPPGTSQAEDASLALVAFITRYRRYQYWDAMRIRAIDSLGFLALESTSSLLLEELIDFNPAIARQAALALEKILGPPITVARVLELLGKHGDQEIPRFARGLREMQNQKAIAEELGVAMISYTGPAQEHVQRLLSEIGGVSAFQKLRSLTKSTERYLEVLEKADESLRQQFESTIGEARAGFKIVIGMDMVVFLLGVGLMIVSAIVALSEPEPFSSWSSWITGGGGVLAVIYGRFIARPRAQVEDSVQYLSGLKAVFLGYLRQLRQTDQAYTRRVLEDRPLSAQETKEFNDLIEQTMERSIQRLAVKRHNQTANAFRLGEAKLEAGSRVLAEPQNEGSENSPGLSHDAETDHKEKP